MLGEERSRLQGAPHGTGVGGLGALVGVEEIGVGVEEDEAEALGWIRAKARVRGMVTE